MYIAITIDAEARSFVSSERAQPLDLYDFAPGQLIDRVMNGLQRGSYRDSRDQLPKYTWMLLSGEPYCASLNHDCAAVNSAIEHYAKQASEWGDFFGWHYHNWDWYDRDGDGIAYWNQLLTFDSTQYPDGTDVQLAEKTLAYLVLEKHFYPVLFRSGWTWESTSLSNWLDDVIPFDLSNFSPHRNLVVPADRIANMYDWRGAPVGWIPYHPSSADYKRIGNMKRLIFRTSNDWYDIDSAFGAADSGQNRLVITYTHSYDDGLGLDISPDLERNEGRYPLVRIRFVNALEGIRAILRITDTLPPTISVTRAGDTFVVSSNERLFSFPYGALLDPEGHYVRIRPTSTRPVVNGSSYSWTYDLLPWFASVGTSFLAFAGSDPAGNSFVTNRFQLDGRRMISSRPACEPLVPDEFDLRQNFPNPFNPNTVISFNLREQATVHLAVINIEGQLVKVLLDEAMAPGEHSAQWDGRNAYNQPVGSGVYLYRLQAGDKSITRKMLLVK
ncbi:MAG TPA: T9SS type A sorting domain-containing protein [Candidatus Acidoferrum sp.]|nr:T9SS type A sorting domain-containing protein [Candidatus Acidoferrum sp.]